jgi:hypothetical protein
MVMYRVTRPNPNARINGPNFFTFIINLPRAFAFATVVGKIGFAV